MHKPTFTEFLHSPDSATYWEDQSQSQDNVDTRLYCESRRDERLLASVTSQILDIEDEIELLVDSCRN